MDSVNLAILSSEVTNIVPIFIFFFSNDNFDRMDEAIFQKRVKIAYLVTMTTNIHLKLAQ